MGYEVLDAGGAASSVPSSPLPPSEVVALDDLPPAPSELDPPRPPRRGGVGSRPTPAWHRPGWQLRSVPRTTWALVAVFAVVGAAAGSWWTERYGDQVRQARARGTVQAFATVESVDPLVTGQGTVVDYTIRVINLGTLPLTVRLSPTEGEPSSGAPLVSMISGRPVVAPGGDGLVKVRAPLDCSSDSSEAMPSFAVPVTSADGTRQTVALRESTGPGVGVTPRDLCGSMLGMQNLDVSLTGTLDRPAVVLRNTFDRPLLVTLDPGSPLTQASSQVVSMTTVPRLPVVVPASGTTTLQLAIRAAQCRQDLSERLLMGGYGYLQFQGEPPGVGTDGVNGGVDVSPLVGAAMARACQSSTGRPRP